MDEAANSQRAIIWFLWKEGARPIDIVNRLSAVFGNSACSQRTIYRWIDHFKNGRETLQDDLRSGRPNTSTNGLLIQLVKEMILQDRRVTVREISSQLSISVGSTEEIIHDYLGLNKISARWVPRLLTMVHKQNRVKACKANRKLLKAYGEDFWDRLITVDETWLPFFNPETKQQSKQWRKPQEGAPTKAMAVPSVSKVMITVFWDCEGIILIDYLPRGATINAEYYASLLEGPLRDALRKKRPGKLSAKPILQHDNARPHTARLTMEAVKRLGWELLPHPAYSPDLAPSDYHLFGELKKPLRGIHYADQNDLKCDVQKWVRSTPKQFFETGLRKLVERWDKCIKLRGDYVEKCNNNDDD